MGQRILEGSLIILRCSQGKIMMIILGLSMILMWAKRRTCLIEQLTVLKGVADLAKIMSMVKIRLILSESILIEKSPTLTEDFKVARKTFQ